MAAVSKAISAVEASGGDEQLAAKILEFIKSSDPAHAGGAANGGGAALRGVDEGAREELRFRLHVALGRLGDAGRSALELARLDQVRRIDWLVGRFKS